MFNAGNLVSTLSLNFSAFTQGLNRALATARQVGGLMQQEFNRVNQSATQSARGVNQLGMSFKDMGRIVSGILIAQTFYNIIQGVSRATSAVADFSMEMERAQLSFSRMLGSSERATGFLETMKDFAAVTDFSTGQVVEMSRRLMAFGFEATQIRSVMGIVSDQVAYLGGGAERLDRIVYALGQIKNSSKLAATEVRQLTEAGVNANKYLKDAFKLTNEELQNIGKQGISGADAVTAILAGMRKESAGMVQVLANSMSGMLQTIKDDLLLISERAFAPLFGFFKKYITILRDALESMRKVMRDRGLGGLIESMFPPSVVASIRAIAGAIKILGDAFITLLKAIGPVMSIVGGIFIQTLGLLLPPISRIVQGISYLVYALITMVPPIKYAVAALAALLIANVVARSFMFLYAVLRLGAIFTFVANLVRKLAVAIRVLYVALTSHPIVAVITLIVAAIAYMAIESGKLDGILNKLSNTMAKMSGIDTSNILQPVDNDKVKKSMEEFNKQFKAVGDTTKDIGDEAEKSGKKVKDKFIAAFDEVFQVPDKLDDVKNGLDTSDLAMGPIDFPNDIDGGNDGGMDIPIDFKMPDIPAFFGNIGDKIVSAFEAVPDLVSDLFSKAIKPIEGWLGELIEKLKQAAQGMQEGLAGVPGQVGGAVDSLKKQIQDLLDKLKELSEPIVVSIVIPAIDFVKEKVAQFKKVLQETFTAENVLSAIKTVGLAIAGLVSPVTSVGVALAKLAMSVDWAALGKSISDGVGKAIDVTVEAFSDLGDAIADGWNVAWEATSDFFADLFDIDWSAIGKAVTDGLSSAWDAVVEFFLGIGDWIANNWKEILLGVLSAVVIAVVVAAFATGIGEIIAAIAGAGAGIASAAGSAGVGFMAILGGLTTAIAGIWLVIQRFGDDIGKFFTDLWNDISTWCADAWKGIVDGVSGFVDDVIGFFEDLYTELVGGSIVPDMIDEMTKLFEEFVLYIPKKIGEFVDEVIKKFDTLSTQVTTAFSNMWNSLSTTVSNYWNTITTKVGNIASGVLSKFNTLKTNVISSFTELWKALPGIVSGAWTAITTKVQNIATKIVEIFGGIKGGITGAFSGIYDGIKGILNSLIDLINTAVNSINKFNVAIPDNVPMIGGTNIGFKIKPIPHLAGGGVVLRDTIARIGEGNKKEAIVPLENNTAIMPFVKAIAAELKDMMGSGTPAVAGAPNYYAIGTLIGDSRSIAELERRLNAVRLQENVRKGL